MAEFKGTITLKVNLDGLSDKYRSHPKPATPEAAAFEAEVYLNGPVATEVFKLYGVNLRVHIGS